MVYLGSLLDKAGSIGSELDRRLGMARSDYTKLSQVRKKLRIFEACIIPKLLYCLHMACLNAADVRKFDAFQAACLRDISGIAHISQPSQKQDCLV